MKNKKNVFLSIGGAIAFVVVCYFVYQHMIHVSTDNAQVDAHSVMLSPKVGGYIVKVNVVEGQKVKKDDILVEIDDRDYINTLTQVKGDLTSLEARKHDLEKNYHRLQDLYSKGVVSQQQYDTASSNFSETKAKYDATAAQVAQAQLNYEYTKIKAPSDGFIAKKSAEVGQLAAPGVPVIGFVDLGERWVTANFKETELEGISLGNHVDIDVDAISNKKFHGEVVAISSATGATFTLLPADNATGNFTKVVQRVPVKIEFKDLTTQEVELLKAGLSAIVSVKKN